MLLIFCTARRVFLRGYLRVVKHRDLGHHRHQVKALRVLLSGSGEKEDAKCAAIRIFELSCSCDAFLRQGRKIIRQ
jgi:hypothetical protein